MSSVALRATDAWPLEQILQGLVITTALGSVMAVGSVHVPTMLVVGTLATASLVVALLLERGRRPPDGVVLPAWLLWALAGYTLVQLVPLPMSLLRVIAPSSADIWSRALLPLDRSAPAWATLSLDPAATALEVLRWFSYGAVVHACAALARRRSVSWGAMVIFGTGMAAAVVTVAHGLLGAKEVFGLYSPTLPPRTWIVGPLLNVNNLSGLLNISALAGLGLLVTDRPPLPRWATGVGVAVLVGVNVAAGSRAGVAALLLGLVAMGVAVEMLRRRQSLHARVSTRMRAMAMATIAFGGLLALLGGTSDSWKSLLDENLEKLALIAMVERAVGDFAWLGMGRGAFESVFPAYQLGHGDIVFTHAENFIAQWVVEWGIPVTVLAILAFVFALAPRRMGASKSVVAMALWLGVVMVLLQNMVDLGMEVPGLVVTLATAIGFVWGGTRSRSEAGPSRSGIAMRRVATAGAVGLGLVAIIALFFRYDLASDRQATRASLLTTKAPRPAAVKTRLRESLAVMMRRHPAEAYFPLMGGLLASEERDADPMPWLQRALERSLANGKAHLLVAHILRTYRSLAQSRLELRLAVEADPTLVMASAELAHQVSSSLVELEEVVPKNAMAGKVWSALGSLAATRAVGAACDEKALTVDASLTGPRLRLARDLIAAAKEGSGCQDDARAGCGEAIDHHVAALRSAAPETTTGDQIAALWRARTEGPEAGLEVLSGRCEAAPDADSCLRVRAEIAAEITEAKPFAEAAKALALVVCADRHRCAEIMTWIATLHDRRGELGAAIASLERAIRDEETDARLLKLADVASRAGLLAQAQRALEKVLKRRGGKDPAIAAQVAAVRQRLVRGLLKP
ncbi:MAG: O-antigen ligase family protein [Polyangiaceae bacterium]